MAGRVVHVKKDPHDVYIGRGKSSIWGNPFRIGDAHSETGRPTGRREAIELYMEWIVRGERRHLLTRLGELEGEILGCFCAPSGGVTERDPLVCHGQVLLILLDWRRKRISGKRRPTPRSRSRS